MTTILRLQGLDKNAGTEDIRRLFKCLHIPDGGVYIVGGSLREAFIAFTTERDAQLAKRYSGKVLKGSKVTLHLSSMEELEHKLKLRLKRKKSSASHLTVKSPQSSPDAKLQLLKEGPRSPNTPTTASPHDPRTVNRVQPLDTKTSRLQPAEALDTFLLGMCTVIQSLRSSHQGESDDLVSRVDFPNACGTDASNDGRTPEQTPGSKPGYVRLFGLPPSVTKEIICHFFRGLTVKEAIVNVKLGLGHGCLVKFASEQEARDALLFNHKSLDDSCVDVRGATEKMWTMAQQECEKTFDAGERVKPKKSPLKETANHKERSTTLQTERRSDNRLPSKSKKPRLEGDRAASPPPTEYTVMVRNLPETLTKTDIKELFECPNISHKNVLHLLDKEGNRTDTAFLIFNRTEDYDNAMNLTGCHVGSNAIEVSSITKMTMKDMMREFRRRRILAPDPKEKPNHKRASPVNADPALQTCLFVRNMPADVRKSQIRRLFSDYELDKDNIILLFDRNGKGIGEAVVQFNSQKLTALAQRLQGQDFMGSELFLTPITVKQMEEILATIV